VDSAVGGWGKIISGCVAGLVAGIAILMVLGLGFTVLWNLFVPSAFNGPTLAYYEGTAMVGFMVLAASIISTSFFRVNRIK